MSLVNETEFLCTLTAAGELTATEAAQHLTEYSDGGLTRLGAQDLITRHRDIRSQYEGIGRVARDALDELGRS